MPASTSRRQDDDAAGKNKARKATTATAARAGVMLVLGALVFVNVWSMMPGQQQAPRSEAEHDSVERRRMNMRFRNDVVRPNSGRKLADPAKIPVAEQTQCAQGFNGDDMGTTHGTLDSPKKNYLPSFPCAEFKDRSCCTNVHANEISMGYDHFFSVGGTSVSTPRETNGCFYHARSFYTDLNEYFCMFCNPDHLAFMGCCQKDDGTNAFGLGPTYAGTTADPDQCDKCLKGANDDYGADACMQLTEVTLANWSCASGDAGKAISQGAAASGEIFGCDGSKYKVAVESGAFNTHDEVAIDYVGKGIPKLVANGKSLAECIAGGEDCAGKGGASWSNKCGWDGMSCNGKLVEPGATGCTPKDINIIRVCQSFADEAYNKAKIMPMGTESNVPGANYDDCGVLIWIGQDETSENPDGITPFFDVDGTTGDDPVMPSKKWASFTEFARSVKPPLFGEFGIVVVPDKATDPANTAGHTGGNCFAGADNRPKAAR